MFYCLCRLFDRWEETNRWYFSLETIHCDKRRWVQTDPLISPENHKELNVCEDKSIIVCLILRGELSCYNVHSLYSTGTFLQSLIST